MRKAMSCCKANRTGRLCVCSHLNRCEVQEMCTVRPAKTTLKNTYEMRSRDYQHMPWGFWQMYSVILCQAKLKLNDQIGEISSYPVVILGSLFLSL